MPFCKSLNKEGKCSSKTEYCQNKKDECSSIYKKYKTSCKHSFKKPKFDKELSEDDIKDLKIKYKEHFDALVECIKNRENMRMMCFDEKCRDEGHSIAIKNYKRNIEKFYKYREYISKLIGEMIQIKISNDKAIENINELNEFLNLNNYTLELYLKSKGIPGSVNSILDEISDSVSLNTIFEEYLGKYMILKKFVYGEQKRINEMKNPDIKDQVYIEFIKNKLTSFRGKFENKLKEKFYLERKDSELKGNKDLGQELSKNSKIVSGVFRDITKEEFIKENIIKKLVLELFRLIYILSISNNLPNPDSLDNIYLILNKYKDINEHKYKLAYIETGNDSVSLIDKYASIPETVRILITLNKEELTSIIQKLKQKIKKQYLNINPVVYIEKVESELNNIFSIPKRNNETRIYWMNKIENLYRFFYINIMPQFFDNIPSDLKEPNLDKFLIDRLYSDVLKTKLINILPVDKMSTDMSFEKYVKELCSNYSMENLISIYAKLYNLFAYYINISKINNLVKFELKNELLLFTL